ncbi:type 4a pilus biogenesis protein PilO [Aliikangiella maris]|uniref:Type 4a pilus biogenesis protein PilO n=2 Tax=Aliikangiella maris TaxID=3162458 RepID=A0ABV2BWK8_9GAMM
MNLEDLKNFDLSTVDYSNMGSWSAMAKGIVAALVFILVLIIGYYLFVEEQTDLLADIEKKEIEFKQEFERKQAKAVNLDAYKRQMKTIKDSFKTLLQQLPRSEQMAELVEEFSYAATGAGCVMDDVKFLSEKDSEFYTEKPISMRVTGGYHQLADFVSRISRLPRIVTLHDFKISLGTGDVPTSPGEKLLIMTITAKTYRADSEEK